MKIFKSFFLLTTILSSGKTFGSELGLDIFSDQFIGKGLKTEEIAFTSPTMIPFTEMKLQLDLQNEPGYVVAFFESIFSAVAKCEETGKLVIDPTMGKIQFSSWNKKYFEKNKAMRLIQNITKLDKKVQTQLLEFLTHEIEFNSHEDLEVIVEILSAWPNLKKLQDKVGWCNKNLSKYSSPYLATLYSYSKYFSSENWAISYFKEKMIGIEEESNFFDIITTVTAMLMARNEELNYLLQSKIGVIERIVRQEITREKKELQAQNPDATALENWRWMSHYTHSLCESPMTRLRKIGRDLIVDYIENSKNEWGKDWEDQTDAISYLFLMPEFIDEGKQLFKTRWTEGLYPYASFESIFREKKDFPEIEAFFVRDYLLDLSMSPYDRGRCILPFFDDIYSIKKGVKYLHQILASPGSDDSKKNWLMSLCKTLLLQNI